MKKVKSIVCMTACIGVLAMAGCNTDKTPISGDTFSEKMEEAGLSIHDQTAEKPEELGMSDVRTAIKEGEYQIEFYEFKKEEDAKSLYKEQEGKLKDKYESEKGTVKTSKERGNYASYKLYAEDEYYVLSRIGNTLVYSTTTGEYKNQVKKLVEDLKY